MELLPEEVTIDIFSRLSVKTVIHCKIVCKKWRNLIFRSDFVNLHLSRSPTGLIIHYIDQYANTIKSDPGNLKWVEIEDKVDHHHPLTNLDLNLEPIFQSSQILQTGSVNGLICLWQYYYRLDNTYICNPITREYILLPRHRYHWQSYYIRGFVMIVYGFGVSSVTGEYKVVRIFQGDKPPYGCTSSRPTVLEAEVYTLGTGQWRSIGHVPYWLDELHGPFLNDHCHWIICDKEEDAPEKLCTFDLNKETFQLFPSPPSEAIQQESRFHFQSLAVLRGCLCKVDTYDSRCTIWVMKEYGIKKSWHKEVVIPDFGIGFYWPHMSVIEGLEDGSILMFNGEDALWAYYPQSNTLEETEMFDRFTSALGYHRGLAYHPSFLKLDNFESERVHMF